MNRELPRLQELLDCALALEQAPPWPRLHQALETATI